ncbi:MAG: RNA methyltransferase [Culturomica sp.]|jgi:TrmH family RNA methyltransferase|nr:RNA methyltransferase [Culturomica sp.]
MLGKQLTKIVQSLEKKKFREKYNLFKAEGEKLVEELLRSDLHVERILASPAWIERNQHLLPSRINRTEVTPREMEELSGFQSVPEVLALADIPEWSWQEEEVRESLSLVLNGIQDPGNLGTILRIADWFGVRHVFCDRDCASAFNPKAVQASMGAVFRVRTCYTELEELIDRFRGADFPCYGTFLEGSVIYRTALKNKGFIVMGNEGKGINEQTGRRIDVRLTIPSFAGTESGSESLNVGVATGIILSEFKRNIYL